MAVMRRADRQTDRASAWEILENAPFLTLSMNGAEGAPYGVTLSFVRMGEHLYFHSAPEGYKVESLKKDPRVCLTAVGAQRTVADGLTVAYGSAVAFGKAFLVEDPAEKEGALLAICKKYAPSNPNAAAYVAQYPQTAVWRIEILSITGKVNRGE